MSASGQHLDDLRSRYQSGSLYLTYIPINDLTQLLADKSRRARFKQETSKESAVDSFWDFLQQHRFRNMNEGIAFLQLNLNALEAGFKKISDRDGVIHKVSWSASTIQGVAELSDIYFNSLTRFEEQSEALRSVESSLKEAWTGILELKDNPFMTNARIASLLYGFKVMVDQRPRELAVLKAQDTATHAEIERVKNEYDEYLRKQEMQQSLRNLWSKEAEIADGIARIDTAQLDIDKILTDKGVLGELKACAIPFEQLGFLSGLDNSNREELFQINAHLNRTRFVKGRSKLGTLILKDLDLNSLGNFGGDGFGKLGGGGGFGNTGGGGFSK